MVSWELYIELESVVQLPAGLNNKMAGKNSPYGKPVCQKKKKKKTEQMWHI